MMRKLVPSILIFSLIFNSFGFFVGFIIIQQKIKSDVRRMLVENLPENVFEKVIIPKSIITSNKLIFRMTESDEFVYRGKMFDFVKKVETKETIIFYAINDEQEENLLSRFSDQINNNLSDLDGKVKTTINLLVKIIYSDIFFTNEFSKIILPLTIGHTFYNTLTYQSFITEKPTPPPKPF